MIGQGFNDKTPVWYSLDGAQFRDECFADEVRESRLNHRGWYCDTIQESVARGIIGRLTHGRFITGYYLSLNDERVYFPGVFDDETDAAHAADEHARVIGEQEMEHAERFDAAIRLESKIEDSLQRLRECFVLRHHGCMGYARDEISELIETIRDSRDTLANEFKGVL